MDARLLDWLRCPECRGRLEARDTVLHCGGCGRRFAMCDGIPIFTTEASATADAFGYMWGGVTSAQPPATPPV